jgi:hypothetical protein
LAPDFLLYIIALHAAAWFLLVLGKGMPLIRRVGQAQRGHQLWSKAAVIVSVESLHLFHPTGNVWKPEGMHHRASYPLLLPMQSKQPHDRDRGIEHYRKQTPFVQRNASWIVVGNDHNDDRDNNEA